MTHLQHTGQLSDDRLAQLATAHLVKSASLQLVAELLTRLREMNFPWWTPEQLRRAYPAVERMRWLDQRPDVRQRITTQLTGLAPRAARGKSPDFQAELIDSVIDEGDISLEVFEAAFEPADLAVYGPAEEFFQLFKRRMPWEDDSTPHQDLVGWLIGAFIADKSALDNSPRTPVLSALDVRTAIDGVVWHSRIPLHVRVGIDEARFVSQRERPYEPFTVDRELTIATPALIAASIPLKDLLGVVDLATVALGFEDRGGREHAARSAPAATLVAEGTDDGPRPELQPEPAAVLASPVAAPPVDHGPPTDPPAPGLAEPAPVEPALVEPAPAGELAPSMADEPTGAAEEGLEQATMKRHDSLSLSDGWEAAARAPVAPAPEGSSSELESTGQWRSGAAASAVDMDDD